MKHYIEDNLYRIESEDGEVLLSIQLTDEPGDQIILDTETERFAGPIHLLLK